MAMLQIHLTDASKFEVVKGILKLLDPTAQIIESFIRPEPDLRREIANALFTHSTTQSRKLALVAFLLGGNSFDFIGFGDATSLRWDTMAVNRVLKKLLPSHPNPIELLFESRRTYFPDGNYKGIEYVPTEMGRWVYDNLKSRGYFN